MTIRPDIPEMGARLGRPAARGWRGLLDLVLPPQCLSCGGLTGAASAAGAGALCAACWQKMSFISAPYCAACGYPFEFDAFASNVGGGTGLCGPCLARPPAYERARAVLRYDDASRGLLIAFKHADRTHAAPAFAGWMARAGVGLLAGADVIAPVPLHPRRLWARRYNQAALLGLALARLTETPCLPGLLERTRATPPQGRLGRLARARNVRRAFRVCPRHLAHVTGRRVLLVDDVLTTGATVEEAARVLRAAGATAVDVLTLARVVRPV